MNFNTSSHCLRWAGKRKTELQQGAFAGAACLFSKPPLLINVTAERAAAVLKPGWGRSGERQASDNAQDAWAVQPFLLLYSQKRKRKEDGTLLFT